MPNHPPAPVEEEIVELLSSVPIGCYEKNKDLYMWPQKNECTVCGEGTYRHKRRTAILVCTVCHSELHIPHQS